MASSDRSTPIPYTPAPPPTGGDGQQLSRATWDELYRIAERFESIDRPAALAVTSSKSCPIQAATVWTRLFNTGITYEWQAPLGQFDAATGIWTCPQEGLYSVTVTIEIPAFPSPGQRLYTATLRTTGNPLAPGPDKVMLSKAGGPDEAPLRFSADFLRPLNKGDQLYFDLDLTEEAFTGNVTVFSILNIVRQGTIR